jgi:hypothetical protein
MVLAQLLDHGGCGCATEGQAKVTVLAELLDQGVGSTTDSKRHGKMLQG